MREILFRGKNISKNKEVNGKWIDGNLILGENNRTFIAYDNSFFETNYNTVETNVCTDRYFEVDPETVGQYTRLDDANGVKIFENDIVRIFGNKYTVAFECGSFGIFTKNFIEYKPFEERIFEITRCDNNPHYTYNDNFMPLWEIYWNFNCEDCVVELIEVIGNIHDNPELLEVNNG